jgi:tetratricopeptide (TPR) repeat protein
MPPPGARNRWQLAALTCVLILGVAAAGGVLWIKWRAPSHFEQATAAYDRKDWPAAEKALRAHLRKERNHIPAWRLLARVLYRQGRSELASDVHKRVSDDRLEAEDYFLVGQALERQGQIDRAIYVWKRALKADPDHVETLMALAQALARKDQLHEAAVHASRLLSRAEWEARAALLLGRIRAGLSDPAAAALAYERALAHLDQWYGFDTPDRVRIQRARALLATGRPALAQSELLKLSATHDPSESSWLLSRCDLQQGRKSEVQVAALAHTYRETHFLEPEPALYVGETRCFECHKSIFQTQHASRHASTFVHTDQLPELHLPTSPVPDPSNPKVTHTFQKRGGRVEMETSVRGSVLETIFDYAFGSGDRGLTLVGHDRGNKYYESRISAYPDTVGWDVTSGHPVDANLPASLYQGMPLGPDAVRRCLICHATNAHAVMTGTSPVAADKAIGCEQCHGPGGNHVQAVAMNHQDLSIARPALASGSAIVAICARCHSPRGGDRHLAPGAEDSVRFQGTTLTWSRCYTESGNALDCVTCHNPHRNAETVKDWYESRCLGCHSSSGGSVSRPAARSRRPAGVAKTICPVEPTRNCITCHMPKVKSTMVHTLFTDHFIRVHGRAERSAGREQAALNREERRPALQTAGALIEGPPAPRPRSPAR